MKKYFIFLSIIFLFPFSAAFASFNTSLGYGASGSSVAELQSFLISQKCLSVQPTGYFGSLTFLAVKCFQNKYSVSATGYFGVLSRAVANELATIPESSVSVTTPATSSSNLPAQGVQGSVNLSQGVSAAPAISSLAGAGSASVNISTTTSSPYSISSLAGDGQVQAASSTDLSQGVNAPPALSPLIGSGSVSQ